MSVTASILMKPLYYAMYELLLSRFGFRTKYNIQIIKQLLN